MRLNSFSWLLLLVSTSSNAWMSQVEWSYENLTFSQSRNLISDAGTVNPDNRIAQLSAHAIGNYMRPTIKYEGDKFSWWFKPRFHIDADVSDEMSGKHNLFTHELKTKWQFHDDAYWLLGRYTKEFGPSIFYSPSNPFIIENGQLNPKFEIDAMDFMELNFTLNEKWETSLVFNFSPANNALYSNPFFDFEKIIGLNIDYYGFSESISVIVSSTEDKQHHLGIYAQKNISDALLIWGDIAADKNINRFYAANNDAIPSYEAISGETNEQWFGTALLGGSYTLTVGPTLIVEYSHTEKGLDNTQATTYFNMINYSTSLLDSPLSLC